MLKAAASRTATDARTLRSDERLSEELKADERLSEELKADERLSEELKADERLSEELKAMGGEPSAGSRSCSIEPC
jgi:transposase